MNIDEIKEKILCEEEGCKFYKSDLHLHTPASKDYIDKDATPHQIVDNAISKGLKIIAITDHNSVEWCEKIIDAAKGKNISVFPGVEIGVKGGKLGLHLIALFDTKKPIQEIKDCLAKIGIDTKKQGKTDALSDKSIDEILEEIKKNDGIVIGAHAYSAKGIVNGWKGKQRTSIIRNINLCAIEIINEDCIKFYQGKDSEYKRWLACIKCSDAHKLEDIGKEFTFIKLGKVSIEGIRQAFCDPQSRIRFNPSQLHKHPFIIGMYVKGGFLDNQTFRFNENMNSLIGGKGTGKTTAIELIRYVLCSKHKNEALRKECEEMVKGILGEGIVYLLIKTKDQQYYIIQREINRDPIIYGKENQKLDININNFFEFFDIEGYSQGELICIARESSDQLRMLDKYINFGNLGEQEKNLISKLSGNATTLQQNDTLIEEWNMNIEKLPSINEKIRIIEEKGLKKHSDTQKKWEYEKSVLQSTINAVTEKKKELLGSPKIFMEEIQFEQEKLINKKLFQEINKGQSNLNQEFTNQREVLIKKCGDFLNELNKKILEWKMQYEKELEKFKKIIDELKDKGIDINTFLELEQEKNQLDKLKEDINKKKVENKDLLHKREEMLKSLFAVRKAISEKRDREISNINTKLKDMLHIDLLRNDDTTEYTDWMIDCLRGSNLRKEYTQILCQKIKPSELFDIINKKREDCVDILSSKTNLNKTYFEKLINFPSFITKQYELQVIKLEDTLIIKLNDQGWKPLQKLSAGGKCTAILLIAMLERSIPLVIDQPEDSLDNAFIYTSIVKIIRKLKDKRQLIIVTHNANIPVLGDCELMFELHYNGLQGDIRTRGVIDSQEMKEKVQIILEGGEEAFKKRREKYGIY